MMWRGLGLALGLCQATVAVAAPAVAPPVIAVRGDTLARLVDTTWEAVGVVPADAGAVRSLVVRGDVVLLASDNGWYWSRDGGTWRRLVCTAHVSVDPSGEHVLCNSGSQVVRVAPASHARPVTLKDASGPATWVTIANELHVVWSAGGQVWRQPMAGGRRVMIAPEAPIANLSINPAGTRAVGQYAGTFYVKHVAAPGVGMFSFALDGKGVRRATLRHGEPRQWSVDGQWVLMQEGAKACIVRATGGEYKCWDGQGVSLSPDGSWLLLARADGLYRAVLRGPRALPAVRIDDTARVAAFVQPAGSVAATAAPRFDRLGRPLPAVVDPPHQPLDGADDATLDDEPVGD